MSHLEPLPVLIKLYPNRRLYDGEIGRYRSFDELPGLAGTAGAVSNS
jgi:polyhydroxyalkanoate synthesis regulator protein